MTSSLRKFSAAGLASLFLLTGCVSEEQNSSRSQQVTPSQTQQSSEMQSSQPIHVVTSFYPLYELAKNIGGDKVAVENLVPAGSEPHDYEPTPQDIVALNNANLVIVNGAGLEPWIDKIVPDLQSKGVKVINQSEIMSGNLLQSSEKEEGQPANALDPHIWLDPVTYQKEGELVEKTFVEIDPADAPTFEKNYQDYAVKLQALDQKYATTLKTCATKNIVTGHAAFAYLSKRYNLAMVPIAGLSPDSEPSAKELADLTKYVKENNIQYVFTETLVSPKLAQTLADEAHIKTLVLNPLEGLTDDDLQKGENYVSVMEENLVNLKTALACS